MDEKEMKKRIAELKKRFGVSEETAQGAAEIQAEVSERLKEHTERMQRIREGMDERKRRRST